MSSAEQNEELSSIKQLRQALERIPGGVEAVRLMTRLGLRLRAYWQPGLYAKKK